MSLVSFSAHWAAGSPRHQRLPYERDSDQRLLDDELLRQPQDGETQPAKASIPPGIRSGTLRVIAAINLDDEADRRCEEVSDVAADDDLAPKLNAELFTTQVQPKQ